MIFVGQKSCISMLRTGHYFDCGAWGGFSCSCDEIEEFLNNGGKIITTIDPLEGDIATDLNETRFVSQKRIKWMIDQKFESNIPIEKFQTNSDFELTREQIQDVLLENLDKSSTIAKVIMLISFLG